jgi:hypothetical protein
MVAWVRDADGERVVAATWRDLAGAPFIEQFTITGLDGDDDLGFLAADAPIRVGSKGVVLGSATGGQTFTLAPLDVSGLTARSVDWVGVIDGGPGNDAAAASATRPTSTGSSAAKETTIFSAARDSTSSRRGRATPTVGSESCSCAMARSRRPRARATCSSLPCRCRQRTAWRIRPYFGSFATRR